jgi:hypothetical protein
MRNRRRERKLHGSWASIQSAIWLIGLAIIAWKGWWWPGILVLLAISSIFQAIVTRFAPEPAEKIEQTPVDTPEAASVPEVAQQPVQEHRPELFPAECPKCGGPIRGHELRWTGPQSADCPYCGANLPVKT